MNTSHSHHGLQRCGSADSHSNPSAALCALCLRERLAGIDSQASYSGAQLSRTKSCSSRGKPTGLEQPRRRSCDARPQGSSLQDLFVEEDEGYLEKPASKSRFPNLEPALMEEEEVESCRSRRRGFVVEDSFLAGGEKKMMKELIDLEVNGHGKNGVPDLNEIASGFTRKLKKLKLKSRKNANAPLDQSKAAGSKIVEWGLERRSCDADPRLCIDAARVSFDEPRASWDGCLIGSIQPHPKSVAPLIEQVEECSRKETNLRIRRSRGYERSSSVKIPNLEADVSKVASNAQVSPETGGEKLMVTEKELRDSNWYSLGTSTEEGGGVVSDTADGKKKSSRFSVRNMWALLQGRSNERRGVGRRKRHTETRAFHPKCQIPEDKEIGCGVLNDVQNKAATNTEGCAQRNLTLEKNNVIKGSLAESLLKLRRTSKGNGRECINYSLKARNSCDGSTSVLHAANGFEGGRKSCDGSFMGVTKESQGKGGMSLQRNTSTRYPYPPPDNLDEKVVLPFYFTPLRSFRGSRLGREDAVVGGAVIERR